MEKIVPEREEAIGFEESEEIDWRQYLTDFKSTVWPMFAKEGFTFPEALMFWRQEILLTRITQVRDILDGENS